MFAKKTFLNTKAKLARKNARFTRSLVLISKLERKILPNEIREMSFFWLSVTRVSFDNFQLNYLRFSPNNLLTTKNSVGGLPAQDGTGGTHAMVATDRV